MYVIDLIIYFYEIFFFFTYMLYLQVILLTND
jgi:hypothetical protein